MKNLKDKIKNELFQIISDHFEELTNPDNDYSEPDKIESMIFLILNILSNTSIFDYDLELFVNTPDGKIKLNDDNLSDDFFNSTLNF